MVKECILSIKTKQKRERTKVKNVHGEAYITVGGKEVSSKDFSYCSHCCLKSCWKQISFDIQKELHAVFYNGQDKSLQDSFLAKCMERSSATWSKQTVNPKKDTHRIWQYF